MNALSESLTLLNLNLEYAARRLRHPGEGTSPAPGMPQVVIHGGLNKSDLHDPRQPVLVQVVIQWFMQIGDSLVVWVNNAAVATDVIKQEHVELGVVTFGILPRYFLGDQLLVHYHHFTAVGGNETVSLDYGPYPIKRSVPGSPDPVPSTPYTNESLVAIELPVEVDPGSALTVTIARYENIFAGDVITLHWASELLSRTVTAQEASDPSLPLNIVVPADLLIANPGSLVVEYEVHDIVRNWSLFSLPAYTQVPVPGSLRAPEVRDADDDGRLDVDALGGRDVDISVFVRDNIKVVPNTVNLTWRGQSIFGQMIERTVRQDIAAEVNRITVRVPHADAKVLVGSTATVFYEALLPAPGPTHSIRTSVSVIGQAQVLEVPRLVGVTGDVYDPELIVGSHQVVIINPYSFMAVGQKVVLSWEGLSVEGETIFTTQTETLTEQEQVGKAISFLVLKSFASVLAGGSLRVSYRVDAGGVPYPSPVRSFTVVGAVLLPAPITEPFFPGGLVDPAALGPTLDVIVLQSSHLQPGDDIALNWSGSSASGSARFELKYPSVGNLLQSIAKDPLVIANSNASVDVWYEARRAGSIIGHSSPLSLRIGDAAQLPWLAPTVEDATFTSVNPINPIVPNTVNRPNTATVVVRDSRIQAGDDVAVAWVLSDGYRLEVPGQIAQTGGVRIPVPDRVLTLSMNNRVQLAYVVVRGGASLGSSQVLNLQVLAIAAASLPIPVIPDAQGPQGAKVLDVGRLTGDAAVQIPAWARAASGQRVWLRLYGEGSGGALPPIVLANGVLVRDSEVVAGFQRNVSLAALQTLSNGSVLRVEAKVHFGEGEVASDADAVAFQLLTVHVVNEPVSVTENFDRYPTRVISAGQSIALDSMDITLVSGAGSVAIAPSARPAVPGKVEGNCLHLHYNGVSSNLPPAQTIRIVFKTTYRKVSFWTYAVNYPHQIAFIDTSGSVIAQRTLQYEPYYGYTYQESVSHAGIAGLVITLNSDWLWLDNFVLEK